MKSKKVEVYMKSLSPEVFPKIVGRPEAIRVAEIAEEEAEERVRAELTRWHDPKVKLPEEHIDVEVKTDAGKVSVCNLETDDKGNRFWNVSRTNYVVRDVHVIGWREIYE